MVIHQRLRESWKTNPISVQRRRSGCKNGETNPISRTRGPNRDVGMLRNEPNPGSEVRIPMRKLRNEPNPGPNAWLRLFVRKLRNEPDAGLVVCDENNE
jgi:hypothetical protein